MELITVDDPDGIEIFQLLRAKYALKLEVLGMKNSKGSVYAIVKHAYGFKGTKLAVFQQLEALIETKKKEREQKLTIKQP